MFFLYSDDNFLLKKHLEKMIKSLSADNLEVETYSFIENTMSEIVDGIQTFSFFNDQKIVVLKDAWFVTEKKVALHKTFDVNVFWETLKKGYNQNNILIFTLETDKLSNRLKIGQWFQEQAKVDYIKKLDEPAIKKYLTQSFLRKNKTIELEAVEYLVRVLPNEMQIMSLEVNKLLKLPQQNITLGDVKENTTHFYEYDIFQLVNEFLTNDLNKFIVQYQNYKIFNLDNIGLFTLMGNNLSILRDALILQKQGYANNAIAEKIGVNAYRLKMLMTVKNNSITQLNDKIKMLYNIIKRIVTGEIDPIIIPEYELIKLISQGGLNNGC
ncbi:DNA polymerase III subunit delta [Williamsoniiplasma lucivorax]|uniref:DNA polymerase III subunit delta n=2 Tax=Williamsoniiplasma lucivorax TaxID=209274 RepID=A0A2S5RCU3_9MOLU|nr:hypothetical protein [Williamsoniiplasma lucivorax]PPE05143.1 DNA polymerase III subunit delta [Williamsoniiplasma lucivorax]